jgi:hypothetical protein
MLMIQGNKKSWKLLIFQCKLLEIYIALRCSCLTLNFFFCAFGVHSFSLRGRYNICYYKQLKKNLMTHFWIEVFQVYSGQCLERVSDFFSVFAHFILYICLSFSNLSFNICSNGEQEIERRWCVLWFIEQYLLYQYVS